MRAPRGWTERNAVRITFIEPAPPGFHIYSFIKQVRLGLPLMATLLRDLGHDVRVCVETLGVIDWARVLSSDVVGISTTTSTAIRAYQYSERVREAGIPVVMGGPHVTFETAEALEFCDYVVRGEGEDTMLELVDFFEGRRDHRVHPRSLLPRSRRRSGAQRGAAAARRDLRSSLAGPQPDRSPPEDQTPAAADVPRLSPRLRVLLRHHDVRPPGPPGGQRVRAAGVGSRWARTEVFFYDDNFIMSKPRTKALLAEMIRRRLPITFTAQIRVDSICRHGKVDHELLQLLKGAGCYMVYLGLGVGQPGGARRLQQAGPVE